VWSRLHDKLLAAINGGSYIKKQMFHMGFQSKKEALKNGQSSTFWDTILFSKMKARLGGRVRWIMSGSAPLDPNLAEFLKICFCCPVMEGYGLTENAAGACVTKLDETQFGHVGRPLACTEIKLQDVPEMNYTSKNNSGEIMLRGPNIFKGYFKDPEKTKEAIDPDGFFHTGDIGRWNSNGTLSIIDRKKNIFKLSQGEYVAVEYLEGVYIRSPFVSQVWVYGSSFKRFLVAVVVPDTDVLLPWAQQNNVTGDVKSLCSDDRINKLILDDMTRIGKEAKLHGFEFVKTIHLTSEPFSVENDLTTPTFKLKRPQLLTHFKAQVDDMYAKIGEDAN
jgi:long-chain acyl-CoA synthetase